MKTDSGTKQNVSRKKIEIVKEKKTLLDFIMEPPYKGHYQE